MRLKLGKFEFGKLYFLGIVLTTVINTFMVLNESRKSRMFMLIAVLVLQHLTLLLFMVDYESIGRKQWEQREKALRKELKD